MQEVRVRTKARASEYQISIGRGLLERVGDLARKHLPAQTGRIALISNKRVSSLFGNRVRKSLSASGFNVSTWLMREGERHKTLYEADRAIQFLQETGLERSDAVVALGGGVVGDLGGFVASIYLRGIPFIQVPTTLLAQIDASIGGKTAVNSRNAKNAIGSFHQPRAVVIDVEALKTLPRRELVAGCCEMVKQSVVASKQLFTQTIDLISHENAFTTSSMLEELIVAHCKFKAFVVASDEREQTTRHDGLSRRILNFGHTFGHALEVLTDYKRFRHGEAVGHGMLAAGELSKNVGLLPESELELLQEAVRRCGRLPEADDLDQDAIVTALASDKKRSKGHIQWVLLERIGKPIIVDGSQINASLIKRSLRTALTSKKRNDYDEKSQG